jgi:thiol:disulfide interchange protein DsbD
MFKTKILYLIVSFLSLAPHSRAEEEPKAPVFRISFSNPSPRAGDVIEVIFKADIPQGLHMYSTYNKCDIGPLKLDIRIVKHKSFSLVGQTFSIGDKKRHDEVFQCEVGEFEKEAEVHQRIKILSTDVVINGTIEGQWCTESTCYNFGSLVPLTFSSALKAAPANSKGAGKAPKKNSKKTKILTHHYSLFLRPNDQAY